MLNELTYTECSPKSNLNLPIVFLKYFLLTLPWITWLSKMFLIIIIITWYEMCNGESEAFPLFVMIRPIINPCQVSMNITVLLLWTKWKVMVIESKIKGYKWNWVFPAWGHLEDWDCNHYCCGWVKWVWGLLCNLNEKVRTWHCKG